jgi:diguanylate cyclase (GGDEF)-like protein
VVELAPIPADDRKRVASLRRLGLLDSGSEERFDRITRTARRMFGVSSALVVLVDVDRNWFKSSDGLDGEDAPRSTSFCGHVVASSQLTVVPDARCDPRFADNPNVLGPPHVRFYAGCPIAAPDGAIVGTLCLTDDQPRTLDDEELRDFSDLAAMVEHEIAVTRLAVDDELTGLVNRRGFLMMANQALAFCQRQRVEALVVFADVDGLKQDNDRHGHDTGDRLLRCAASSMAEAFRGSDVVGRFGGDEFVAVLTGYSGEDTWATERLASAVETCNSQMAVGDGNGGEAEPFALSMSVGSARFTPQDPELLQTLLERADAAMYADKQLRCRPAEMVVPGCLPGAVRDPS